MQKRTNLDPIQSEINEDQEENKDDYFNDNQQIKASINMKKNEFSFNNFNLQQSRSKDNLITNDDSSLRMSKLNYSLQDAKFPRKLS